MHFVNLFLFLLVLSGCSILQRSPSTNEIENLKTELRKENETFRKSLEDNLKITIRNEIIPELRELSTYSSNLVKNQRNLKEKVFKKTVIGRVEWISTVNPKVSFRARVDTGAQTNSMHAENIKEQERDGKKYVEFTTTDEKGNKYTFLKEILKETKVKSTSGVSEKRYVVQLEVMFGGKKISTNVNLNNRKSLRHNFLIGRNLLLGNYIIDVSQSRLLGEKNEKN